MGRKRKKTDYKKIVEKAFDLLKNPETNKIYEYKGNFSCVTKKDEIQMWIFKLRIEEISQTMNLLNFEMNFMSDICNGLLTDREKAEMEIAIAREKLEVGNMQIAISIFEKELHKHPVFSLMSSK